MPTADAEYTRNATPAARPTQFIWWGSQSHCRGLGGGRRVYGLQELSTHAPRGCTVRARAHVRVRVGNAGIPYATVSAAPTLAIDRIATTITQLSTPAIAVHAGWPLKRQPAWSAGRGACDGKSGVRRGVHT